MVSKVLVRDPLVKRRKTGNKALKVKTNGQTMEIFFFPLGEEVRDGEDTPSKIICDHKKAVGIKSADFHSRYRNLEIRL